MKKFLIIIIVFHNVVFGQVSADLTIENQQVVGTDFFFDLYLTRTGTNNIYLGNADFVLIFNSSAFTNPILTRESITYWNLTSTSGFPVGLLYRAATSPAEFNGNELVINLNQISFGDQTEFDDNIAKIENTPLTHRLGRYKVSGISNPSAYMELQWKIIGTGVTTQVYTLANVSPWLSTIININAIDPPNVLLSSAPTTFQLSVSVTDGWNMVSIPGLHPVNQDVNTWWSGKDPNSAVFKFSGGYQVVDTVTPGMGYWMKHLGANTYSTGDEWPAGGINIVPHDPVSAASGWNLIGGYEYDIAVSGITTVPSGLQDSPFYGYSGGYQIANFLIPGNSYWIKLSAAGLINFPETLQKNNSSVDKVMNNWGRIIFTDASGKSFVLYSAESNVDLSYFELPPSPPTGMFDIRFASGWFAEDLSSGTKTVEMSGITYPITVRVEDTEIRIQDETGKIVNSLLRSGEEISMSHNLTRLMVSAAIKPERYSLEQNYPNPFNPSTKIEFSLMEDSENVTLTVFNTLGQKVVEFVNSKLDAGLYSYTWDATDNSTGIYLYELRTENFVAVKKMILLK